MVDGAKYTMACGCGAVEMEAHGAPVASCYCHCDNCREARKVNAFAGVPFAPENITFGKGEQSLRVVEPFAGNPDRDHMKNYTCPACGVVMYNTSIFGLRVIALDLVTKANGGAVPSELQPTVHLNYEDRVKDVEDDLPKFADLPVDFGGSGVMMDNQGNRMDAPE